MCFFVYFSSALKTYRMSEVFYLSLLRTLDNVDHRCVMLIILNSQTSSFRMIYLFNCVTFSKFNWAISKHVAIKIVTMCYVLCILAIPAYCYYQLLRFFWLRLSNCFIPEKSLLKCFNRNIYLSVRRYEKQLQKTTL